MKAKDLAEKLLKYPDFDVEFSFTDNCNSKMWTKGFNVKNFEITGIMDIGHSSKIIVLDSDEI